MTPTYENTGEPIYVSDRTYAVVRNEHGTSIAGGQCVAIQQHYDGPEPVILVKLHLGKRMLTLPCVDGVLFYSSFDAMVDDWEGEL